MIPREFYKFVGMRIERDKRQNESRQRNTAVICTVIANFSMTKPKNKQYKISDFMPKEQSEMTNEEKLAKIIQINRALGGVDMRAKEGE